jgi:hypothetical protein
LRTPLSRERERGVRKGEREVRECAREGERERGEKSANLEAEKMREKLVGRVPT